MWISRPIVLGPPIPTSSLLSTCATFPFVSLSIAPFPRGIPPKRFPFTLNQHVLTVGPPPPPNPDSSPPSFLLSSHSSSGSAPRLPPSRSVCSLTRSNLATRRMTLLHVVPPKPAKAPTRVRRLSSKPAPSVSTLLMTSFTSSLVLNSLQFRTPFPFPFASFVPMDPDCCPLRDWALLPRLRGIGSDLSFVTLETSILRFSPYGSPCGRKDALSSLQAFLLGPPSPLDPDGLQVQVTLPTADDPSRSRSVPLKFFLPPHCGWPCALL